MFQQVWMWKNNYGSAAILLCKIDSDAQVILICWCESDIHFWDNHNQQKYATQVVALTSTDQERRFQWHWKQDLSQKATHIANPIKSNWTVKRTDEQRKVEETKKVENKQKKTIKRLNKMDSNGRVEKWEITESIFPKMMKNRRFVVSYWTKDAWDQKNNKLV